MKIPESIYQNKSSDSNKLEHNHTKKEILTNHINYL